MGNSKTKQNPRDFEEYVRDLLECPVCMDTIKLVPVYQCTNGHVICKDCILKLDSCPICRSDSKLARNLMLEQIIAKIYEPQQVKEEHYEKSKLEEWGHGSTRVYFSNDGPIEEPTIQPNLGSNSQHSTIDLYKLIMEAATRYVDRKCIRKFLAIIICTLICLFLGLICWLIYIRDVILGKI